MDSIVKQTRRSGRSMLFMTIVFMVFTTVWAVTGNHSGSVISEVDPAMLGVAGDHDSVFIPMEDIVSVELTASWEAGECLSGESAERADMGTFRNEDCGTYRLYAYKDTGLYIVVRHRDGILVFNNSSRKLTEKTYEELVDASVSWSGKEEFYEDDYKTAGDGPSIYVADSVR